MSSKPLMLEGLSPQPDKDDGLLRQLRREKQQLEDELRGARQELDDLRIEKERMERSVRNLRQQLTPLHRGLRALFGEIELAVGEEEFSAPNPVTNSQAENGASPRWTHAKENFPGVPSQIIDALLSQRELNLSQLSAYCRRDYSTIKRATYVLMKAGLVAKESGKGGKLRLAE